jgi:carbon-monoxide dehydrogenase large subunit
MDAKTQGRAAPEPRVEDDVLVRGQGRYAADVPLAQQAYAYFVRSPHAFARIVSVDTNAAQSARGVVGVFTVKDMEGVGIRRSKDAAARAWSCRTARRSLPSE